MESKSFEYVSKGSTIESHEGSGYCGLVCMILPLIVYLLLKLKTGLLQEFFTSAQVWATSSLLF